MDNWLPWVLGVALPGVVTALGWLLRMILSTRRDIDTALRHVRADLAEFKIEVAKDYASAQHLREVEQRLRDYMNQRFDDLRDDVRAIADAIRRSPVDRRE
jgi:hypothetical protein